MKKEHKALALFSGGLDSLLSVLYMQKLGYEIIPIFFETPFFTAEKPMYAAKLAKLDLKVVNVENIYLEMLVAPKYGYGKNFNPCIDCHGFMFRIAASKMEEYEADFLISGEVLGQRPMSQRYDALNSVRKLSGVKDLIVRPLCQKLLKDTLPITEGWVDKSEMLDIQGRGRHRQIALAKELGLTEFTNPGGGCSLTDKGYSLRLKDLNNNGMLDLDYIKFLKYGRHFRISENTKLIVGRKSTDNNAMAEIVTTETVLKVLDIPGPMGIINSKNPISDEDLRIAASIVLRFTVKANDKDEISYGLNFQLENKIIVEKIDQYELKQYTINVQK